MFFIENISARFQIKTLCELQMLPYTNNSKKLQNEEDFFFILLIKLRIHIHFQDLFKDLEPFS